MVLIVVEQKYTRGKYSEVGEVVYKKIKVGYNLSQQSFKYIIALCYTSGSRRS
jgi:hypothetical protein